MDLEALESGSASRHVISKPRSEVVETDRQRGRSKWNEPITLKRRQLQPSLLDQAKSSGNSAAEVWSERGKIEYKKVCQWH